MNVEHAASIHPATVTEFSEGQHRPRERRSSSRRQLAITSRQVTVHPLVWKTALQRCAGDSLRIEVVSRTEVRIHNDASWRS